MKKIIALLFIVSLIYGCSSIEPQTKLYSEKDVDKVCIYADLANREVRREIERDLAQRFKNTNTEAYESYVLLPKTTVFSNYEMKKKLKDLKIGYYLFIKEIPEIDSLRNTDQPFVEFGVLEGPNGTITTSPQMAAKLIDKDGYPVWSTTVIYDEDDGRAFPLDKDEYLDMLINELAKKNLIELKEKDGK